MQSFYVVQKKINLQKPICNLNFYKSIPEDRPKKIVLKVIVPMTVLFHSCGNHFRTYDYHTLSSMKYQILVYTSGSWVDETENLYRYCINSVVDMDYLDRILRFNMNYTYQDYLGYIPWERVVAEDHPTTVDVLDLCTEPVRTGILNSTIYRDLQ